MLYVQHMLSLTCSKRERKKNCNLASELLNTFSIEATFDGEAAQRR